MGTLSPTPAHYCASCWPAGLAAVRDEVATADASEFEDVMKAAFVRLYLQAREVRLASPDQLPNPGGPYWSEPANAGERGPTWSEPAKAGERGPTWSEPANAGERGLVADTLRWLDQIKSRDGFWWRQVMCSSCYQLVRELNITTIPWWNPDAGAYLSTFQCQDCLPAGIADTRARLARNANNDVAEICLILEKHAVVVHGFRQGQTVTSLTPIVDALLIKFTDGSLVLPIGKTYTIAS
jgi:hypothetical protein